MVKLNKSLSRKQVRILLLTLGLGTIFVSSTVLVVNLIRAEIFILSILVVLVIPGLSTFFDGMSNKFILQKVELFKILGGLSLEIYIFILIYFWISNIIVNVSLVIHLITFELLMIGSVKILLGKTNIGYVEWYRKWLVLAGIITIVFSFVIFFPLPLKEEYFVIAVFITIVCDGLSNFIYGLIKNIEIENSDNKPKIIIL